MQTDKVYAKRNWTKFYVDSDDNREKKIIVEADITSLSGQTPYFGITAEIWDVKRKRDCESCGCLHEDIAKHFPELQKYIKWHLTSTQSPMHYIANSLYWAGFYGYRDGKLNSPPNIEYLKDTCIYGALESDQEFNLDNPLMTKEQLTDWLNSRLDALMVKFTYEMDELFETELFAHSVKLQD